MAEIVISNDRKITQVQGPLESGDIIKIMSLAKIGISIAEKDFMLFGKRENDQAASFEFAINGQTFFMGRTDMYETSDYIKLDTLTFPKGAPASVTVDFRIYLSN